MHQPLIPAGGPDLRTAAIVGNLQRPSGRWPLVSTSGDICSGGHGVPDYDELTWEEAMRWGHAALLDSEQLYDDINASEGRSTSTLRSTCDEER